MQAQANALDPESRPLDDDIKSKFNARDSLMIDMLEPPPETRNDLTRDDFAGHVFRRYPNPATPHAEWMSSGSSEPSSTSAFSETQDVSDHIKTAPAIISPDDKPSTPPTHVILGAHETKTIASSKADIIERVSLVSNDSEDSLDIDLSLDKSKSLNVTCKRFIRTGRLWDVFSGELHTCDNIIERIPVIVKIMSPDSFVDSSDGYDSDESVYFDYLNYNYNELFPHTVSSAESSAYHEDRFYREHLQEVQGGIVPHYYGMFIHRDPAKRDGRPWVYVMLLEDVGRVAPPYEDDDYSLCYLAVQELQRIFDMYDELHKKAKVAHKALVGHHIMRRRDETGGGWAIIDFQNAAWVGGRKQTFRAIRRDLTLDDEQNVVLAFLACYTDDQGKLVKR
ncbi:hypothetical protein IAR55_006782 [Kwoniella newhampshirensis]|uniref:Protein kinase domain-containing protein n=1 Tax=Kwoniella newhampshirensis TaxID=1651941 RepID=A0AAW0YTP5_9TREE